MLKKSKYNFIYNNGEDNYLLYNTYRNSLIELDKLTHHKFKNDFKLLTSDEKNTLYENGFLIDESLDEISHLKHKYNIAKYDNSALSLTIAPTLSCNMSCKYCYENIEKKLRDKNLYDNLLDYIKKRIEDIEVLNITWYGGEPLLELDFIRDFTLEIKKLALKFNKKYNFSMITNGYLLNEKTVKELKSLNINNFQVTLDGGKESHNERRKLKNGNPTYDIILTNIKTLLIEDLKVTIRINIDKTNDLSEIKDILEQLKYFNEKQLNIYIARIENYNGTYEECLDLLDFSEYLIPFYKLLNEYKISTTGLYPFHKTNYCTADQINSFVVDNNGYFYKCWVEIGNKEKICGAVNEPQTSFQFNNMVEYLSVDIFNDEECSNCKFLPLCMGNCPYKNKTKEKNCDEIKLNLEKKIKLYAEILNKEENYNESIS